MCFIAWRSRPNAREPLETSLADAARQHGVDAGADELASHPFDAQSKLVTRNAQAKVDFGADTGEKWLLLRYAPLE